MHRHKIDGIRGDCFRGHNEVTGVPMVVVDQHDHATCFELVYGILNRVELHDLNCPLCRSTACSLGRLVVVQTASLLDRVGTLITPPRRSCQGKFGITASRRATSRLTSF
jgi:hypothetical protein